MGISDSKKSLLSGWWTALVYAAIMAAITYGASLLLRGRLHVMVFERGSIPHFIVIVSCLGIGFLIYQYFQIRNSESNLSKLLAFIADNRDDIASQARSSREGMQQEIPILGKLAKQVPESRERERVVVLLKDWMESGLDFALKRLEIFLELDIQASENAFKVPQIFGWMAPMLGFFGTVWGIALAMGNFSDFMGNVDNVSRIKEGLGMITEGLGIAFDTTILGLFFAIVITGAATYLQRRESSNLDKLERAALDLLKTLCSGVPATRIPAYAEVATAGGVPLDALTEVVNNLSQQLQQVRAVQTDPSSALLEAVGTLQQYVKYLAVIAKQSDTMASQRQALEGAAHAIRNLKDFSDRIDDLSGAARDLADAVKLLQQPREFRLVERYKEKQDPPDE